SRWTSEPRSVLPQGTPWPYGFGVGPVAGPVAGGRGTDRVREERVTVGIIPVRHILAGRSRLLAGTDVHHAALGVQGEALALQADEPLLVVPGDTLLGDPLHDPVQHRHQEQGEHGRGE